MTQSYFRMNNEILVRMLSFDCRHLCDYAIVALILVEFSIDDENYPKTFHLTSNNSIWHKNQERNQNLQAIMWNWK